MKRIATLFLHARKHLRKRHYAGGLTKTAEKNSIVVCAVLLALRISTMYPISVCRLRERGRMSKSVYVRVFHDLKL